MESHGSEGNISSPFGYKLVPWVNWDEWNYVRKSIFSSSPNLISAALQKISAWESRGCLPIAIDLTAMIIEIRQKDPFLRGLGSIGDALASEKMLNMLYCMFIMRLVNDFVEPAHKETARSISSLADAIGIPRTLVDIRHESSHRCLPSLKLARSASAKALEWLKASYWEPQRIAIHDSRKKVKSRVREMISCVTSRRISRASSTKLKIKCSKRSPLLAACHKLSNTSERLLASKSSEIIKVTKKAAHLYSLYASEVVSFLLEIFLSQVADISDEISIEHSDDSDCSVSKPVAGSLIDLKMVITKLSKKKPRLLLDMLKVVLETIEEKGSRNFEIDENHFLSSQNQTEINQVGHLRALVLHLIRNLKALKESGQITLVEENILLSTDNIAAPRILLSNLLHKCLSLLVPGDKHLLKSVLLLSEMSGNRLLTEKLKKLPLLTILDQNIDPSATTLSYNESMLLKEEDSIKKAEERLRNMKSHLLNVKNRDVKHMSCNSDVPTRWSVTKSWVSCPIGMLPCSFSSAAVLPVFDAMEVEREMEKSETTTHVENVCAADEDEMVCDDEEFSDDGNDIKKLKQMPQNEGSPALENPFPMQGRLLIGGVWKVVSEEEFVSLEADVRIFV